MIPNVLRHIYSQDRGSRDLNLRHLLSDSLKMATARILHLQRITTSLAILLVLFSTLNTGNCDEQVPLILWTSEGWENVYFLYLFICQQGPWWLRGYRYSIRGYHSVLARGFSWRLDGSRLRWLMDSLRKIQIVLSYVWKIEIHSEGFCRHNLIIIMVVSAMAANELLTGCVCV